MDDLARGVRDVRPVLTAAVPVQQAHEAFAPAGDRRRAMKVMVTF